VQKLRFFPFQVFAAVFVAQCLWAGAVMAAGPYFDSSESGCDGSDPNLLNCDDFEDGTWIVTNADNGGPSDPSNDGWGGWVYRPERADAYAHCGGKGVAGTDCAAWSGPRVGTSGMMGDFDLGGNFDEVYIRYYMKLEPGFQWGYEKMLTVNQCCAGKGGIDFGTLHSAGNGKIAWHPGQNDSGWVRQNQGNDITLQAPNWYYIEQRIKLNSSGQNNGTYELWVDSCGADGLGCTGSGTLRARHTNVRFRDSSMTIGTVWLENWGNPVTVGESYYDQFVVSRQRVGPVGVTPPTNPPPAGPVAAPTWFGN